MNGMNGKMNHLMKNLIIFIISTLITKFTSWVHTTVAFSNYPSFIHNLACFDWLVYINKLRPDFYIPELNLVIEFQGSQHFIPHRYKDGKKKFELIKDRDRVKLNLLKSHNINVIYFVDIQKQRELEVFPELFEENGYMGETIWTDWNKLETYIKTELNKCTKYKEQ